MKKFPQKIILLLALVTTMCVTLKAQENYGTIECPPGEVHVQIYVNGFDQWGNPAPNDSDISYTTSDIDGMLEANVLYDWCTYPNENIEITMYSSNGNGWVWGQNNFWTLNIQTVGVYQNTGDGGFVNHAFSTTLLPSDFSGSTSQFIMESNGYPIVEGSYEGSVTWFSQYIPGCFDFNADNYEGPYYFPLESTDPTVHHYSFCNYQGTVPGCTDVDATNYNPVATVDDGSCIFENTVEGCTNPNATNYSPDATVDDGSCIFENTVEGCTNPDACNYNPDATVEDGSCEQLTIFVTTYDYYHQMITVNTNAPFCTYEWSLNGATFSETSNELIPAQNGVYQLVVTDALNDCSASQLISVTTVGLDESNINNNINIFPNPASDYIEINTLDQIKSIDVINLIGEIVIHKEVNDETNQRLSVTDLPKGSYIIRLISGTQSYSSIFLKE